MRQIAGSQVSKVAVLALILTVAVSALPARVSATPDVLELEGERRWASGPDPSIEELAIEELVGGGLPEIVSVGGTGTTGEIRVQGYTGSSFFDVVNPVYPTELPKGVAAGNLDADPLNVVEIVTVGCGSSTNGDISLWRVSGGALSRVPGNSQLTVPDACFEDVAVSNLDGDAFVEVIATGYSWNLDLARLEVRSWDGTAWTTKASKTFDVGYDTVAYAVAVGELDGQAPVDIVTVGHRHPTPSSLADGQVAVWHYSTGSLTKVGEQPVVGGIQYGVTMRDVAIGDPDNDLLPEVLAVGYQDWITVNAASQLRTYVLTTSGSFNTESQETRPGEYWLSVAMGDVDNDGQIETVVAGQERPASGGVWGALAVVRARAPPFGDFVHELDRYRWLSWTFPWSTVVGNPDGDLVTEFLTGSQRSPADNAAELRAWNWNVPPKPDDSWPQFHRDAAHSGFSGALAPNTANVVWSKEIQSGGSYSHDRYSPIVYDQKVYVVVSTTLRAYNLDGTNAWPSPVSVVDTFISVTARSVAAGGGRVYYGGAATANPSYGVLSAFQSSDGTLLWTKGSSTFSEQLVWAPPTLAGDQILVGTAGGPPTSPSGKVFAFDRDGNPLWTFSPGADVLASVAVGGTRAYVRAGTSLYSIPLNDPNGDGVIANPGEIDWVFPMGPWGGARLHVALTGSPSVGASHVYIGSHDGLLYKVPRVDPTPGDKLISPTDVTWQSAPLGDWVASTPTSFQAAVYVGADLTFDSARPTNAHFYRLNDANGQIVWTKDYHGRVATSSPAVADAKVFIWAEDVAQVASVYAYDLLGNPLWSKPVHNQISADVGISVAVSAGYLFTSNGLKFGSSSFSERAFLLAIKNP